MARVMAVPGPVAPRDARGARAVALLVLASITPVAVVRRRNGVV